MTCQTCKDTIAQTPAGWISTREGIPDPLACWIYLGRPFPHSPHGGPVEPTSEEKAEQEYWAERWETDEDSGD